MKLIIGVKSCQASLERGDHDVIRSTWGKDAKALGIDVRLFVGAKFSHYESDEIHLDCKDDYNSLPYKTREICKWANGKAVDYIFLCDTDTFLIPKKMLECGFEKYDYVGKIDKAPGVSFKYEAVDRDGNKELHKHCYPWASGGYGYFLSRKAFNEVAFSHPMSYAEDLWVGQVLGPLSALGDISVLSTPANVYSFHHPEHGEIYKIEALRNWMEQMHKEQK